MTHPLQGLAHRGSWAWHGGTAWVSALLLSKYFSHRFPGPRMAADSQNPGDSQKIRSRTQFRVTVRANLSLGCLSNSSKMQCASVCLSPDPQWPGQASVPGRPLAASLLAAQRQSV